MTTGFRLNRCVCGTVLIIATKYVNDFDPSQGVKMTRSLCPYPQIAKYKSSGGANDATNFVCSRTDNE